MSKNTNNINFYRYLPAQLIAAFIKRMSRLSLTAPPHGIVMIIPMIYNLIRRHPSCTVLIHNSNEHVNKLGRNRKYLANKIN